MRIVYFIILFKFVYNYAKNQGLTNSLANISHENLLDNSWFTVNQRGQSSYTDTGNGKYTVDRWKIYNYNTLTVSSNGVSSIALYQYFEEDRVKPLLGKTVTLSILFQDGRIRYSSGQLPNAFPSVDTSYIETNIGGNTWIYITLTSSKLLQVQIKNWSDQVIDVRAVKLEFGSISTLAMDTAPNYQQELAKCQRYFQRIRSLDNVGFTVLATGVMESSTRFWGVVPLPVEMNRKPTITSFIGSNSVRICKGGVAAVDGVPVTSIDLDVLSTHQVKIDFYCASQSSIPVGTYCTVWSSGNSNVYIDLSADL